jgi:hypothetical protein
VKIVFLDFDGVLNSRASHGKADMVHPDDVSVRLGMRGLDLVHVPPLNQILRESGAKIVLSTTWRILYPLERLTALLEWLGVEAPVVGVTPRGAFDPKRGLYMSSVRGLEIQDWLDNHPGVTDFVILDDSSDMAHLMPKLIQTDDATGLTQAHVAPALRLLGVP